MKNIKFVIIIEIIFIIILYLFIETGYVNMIPECFWYKNFGILCPSCGGTRCVINFVKGDLLTSFQFHPILFLVLLYIMVLNIVVIINLITKRKVLKFIYPKSWYVIIFSVVLLIYTLLRNLL